MFSVGDKVVCINPGSSSLKRGKEYTVCEIRESGCVRVKELIHSIPFHSYWATRFELSTPINLENK